jgi:hypothetical protein
LNAFSGRLIANMSAIKELQLAQERAERHSLYGVLEYVGRYEDLVNHSSITNITVLLTKITLVHIPCDYNLYLSTFFLLA